MSALNNWLLWVNTTIAMADNAIAPRSGSLDSSGKNGVNLYLIRN
ncbi:MAG: hypothetical protein RIM23_13895 [Coleofasciculus sp. G3-WIS-01]